MEEGPPVLNPLAMPVNLFRRFVSEGEDLPSNFCPDYAEPMQLDAATSGDTADNSANVSDIPQPDYGISDGIQIATDSGDMLEYTVVNAMDSSDESDTNGEEMEGSHHTPMLLDGVLPKTKLDKDDDLHTSLTSEYNISPIKYPAADDVIDNTSITAGVDDHANRCDETLIPDYITNTPPVTIKQEPGLVEDTPGLVADNPGLVGGMTSVVEGLPGLIEGMSGFVGATPCLVRDVPGLVGDTQLFPQTMIDRTSLSDNQPVLHVGGESSLANPIVDTVAFGFGLAEENPVKQEPVCYIDTVSESSQEAIHVKEEPIEFGFGRFGIPVGAVSVSQTAPSFIAATEDNGGFKCEACYICFKDRVQFLDHMFYCKGRILDRCNQTIKDCSVNMGVPTNDLKSMRDLYCETENKSKQSRKRKRNPDGDSMETSQNPSQVKKKSYKRKSFMKRGCMYRDDIGMMASEFTSDNDTLNQHFVAVHHSKCTKCKDRFLMCQFPSCRFTTTTKTSLTRHIASKHEYQHRNCICMFKRRRQSMQSNLESPKATPSKPVPSKPVPSKAVTSKSAHSKQAPSKQAPSKQASSKQASSKPVKLSKATVPSKSDAKRIKTKPSSLKKVSATMTKLKKTDSISSKKVVPIKIKANKSPIRTIKKSLPPIKQIKKTDRRISAKKEVAAIKIKPNKIPNKTLRCIIKTKTSTEKQLKKSDSRVSAQKEATTIEVNKLPKKVINQNTQASKKIHNTEIMPSDVTSDGILGSRLRATPYRRSSQVIKSRTGELAPRVRKPRQKRQDGIQTKIQKKYSVMRKKKALSKNVPAVEPAIKQENLDDKTQEIEAVEEKPKEVAIERDSLGRIRIEPSIEMARKSNHGKYPDIFRCDRPECQQRVFSTKHELKSHIIVEHPQRMTPKITMPTFTQAEKARLTNVKRSPLKKKKLKFLDALASKAEYPQVQVADTLKYPSHTVPVKLNGDANIEDQSDVHVSDAIEERSDNKMDVVPESATREKSDENNDELITEETDAAEQSMDKAEKPSDIDEEPSQKEEEPSHKDEKFHKDDRSKTVKPQRGGKHSHKNCNPSRRNDELSEPDITNSVMVKEEGSTEEDVSNIEDKQLKSPITAEANTSQSIFPWKISQFRCQNDKCTELAPFDSKEEMQDHIKQNHYNLSKSPTYAKTDTSEPVSPVKIRLFRCQHNDCIKLPPFNSKAEMQEHIKCHHSYLSNFKSMTIITCMEPDCGYVCSEEEALMDHKMNAHWMDWENPAKTTDEIIRVHERLYENVDVKQLFECSVCCLVCESHAGAVVHERACKKREFIAHMLKRASMKKKIEDEGKPDIKNKSVGDVKKVCENVDISQKESGIKTEDTKQATGDELKENAQGTSNTDTSKTDGCTQDGNTVEQPTNENGGTNVNNCEVTSPRQFRDDRFTCKYCDETFISSKEFLTHVNTIHKDTKPIPGTTKCRFCSLTFTVDSTLAYHEKLFHYDKYMSHENFPFRCLRRGCHGRFVTKEQLDEHIEAHQDFIHACDIEGCTRVFRHLKGLMKHKAENHSNKCPHCPFETENYKALQKHLDESHSKRGLMCQESGCEKYFATPESLKAHIKTHMVINNKLLPYHCTFKDCTEAFMYKKDLCSHVDQSHRAERLLINKFLRKQQAAVLKQLKQQKLRIRLGNSENEATDEQLQMADLGLKPVEFDILATENYNRAMQAETEVEKEELKTPECFDNVEIKQENV